VHRPFYFAHKTIFAKDFPAFFKIAMDQFPGINILLKKYFGYDSFRPGQKEIIELVLNNKNSLVLMPTGGGKSICYQVPALSMEGTTLVISPLIALMKDQVEGLKANGVAAAFINSSLDHSQESAIADQCRQGKIKLLYLSPEKAIAEKNRLLTEIDLCFIAIDEAHCVSQWGHDFRPEYTQLHTLREQFPTVPIMALTATADKVTRKDILRQLRIENAETFITSFDRPNLSLTVRSSTKLKDKVNEIIQFIHNRPGDSGIIYCLSRKSTEELSAKLNNAGIACMHYHAGMSSEDRSMVQEKFIRDDVPVICATIAFGMGIDKLNVRWVMHYNMPKNMEGYYQEIGRAGRDGINSDTILYYSLGDLMMLSKFAKESGQPRINIEKLKRMEQYAEARICRRKILLNYFGESYLANCGNCDVCTNPPVCFDGTVIAQKALSALARMQERSGTVMLINVLRGSQSAEVLEHGFDKIKTYGAGKDLSFEAWMSYLLQLIQLGVFEIAYDENYTLKITAYGKKILKGEARVDLVQAEIKAARPITKTFTNKTVVTGASLFESLRQLRKVIADQQGLPAYVIFNDKTLKEMAESKPHTKMQMLSVSGVSENKYVKYGEAFINLIIQNGGGASNDIGIHLSDEKIRGYADQLAAIDARVSHHTVGKALLGSDRSSISEKIKTLPFYGLLQGQTTYKIIGPLLKKYFEKNPVSTNYTGNKPADNFFSPPLYNNMKEEMKRAIMAKVAALPAMRPDSEIDNEYILEQRKTYKRSYEPWSEEEAILFDDCLALTNDLDRLSELFLRNASNLRSAFNKRQAINEE